MESLTNTLVERVQASIKPGDAPVEWGSPLLSTTPKPVAIQHLALQLARTEEALAEIAREIQALTAEVRGLAAEVDRRAPAMSLHEQPAPPAPVPAPLPPTVPDPLPEVPETD